MGNLKALHSWAFFCKSELSFDSGSVRLRSCLHSDALKSWKSLSALAVCLPTFSLCCCFESKYIIHIFFAWVSTCSAAKALLMDEINRNVGLLELRIKFAHLFYIHITFCWYWDFLRFNYYYYYCDFCSCWLNLGWSGWICMFYWVVNINCG